MILLYFSPEYKYMKLKIHVGSVRAILKIEFSRGKMLLLLNMISLQTHMT